LLHKIIEVRNLSSSTYVLRLERNNLEFIPGQCVNLGLVGSGINREYSTYSGCDEPFLEFLIKEVPKGAVSSALRLAAIGDGVELHGPYGSFVLPTEKIATTRFTFICSGTGIAPFHSYIHSYPNLDYRIIAGIRYPGERYDIEDYDPSRITYCVSREPWEGFQGRVTSYLEEIDIDTSQFYFLCGNQRMIQEAYDLIRIKGVSGNKIFTEAFF